MNRSYIRTNKIGDDVKKIGRISLLHGTQGPNLGRIAFYALFSFAIISQLASCAIFDRRNTILVNAVEEHMVPETQPAKLLLSPIYLPVGLMAGVLDAFIVHPIRMIPRAVDDTGDALWEFSDETGYVTHAGSIVYRAGFSPVFFSFAWLARSAFAGPAADDVEAPAERPAGTYEDFLRNRDRSGILYDLQNCSAREPSTQQLVRTYELFSADVADPNLGNGYDSPAYRAVGCLQQRKDEVAFRFFQSVLMNPQDGKHRWVHNNAINYLQAENSERAARVMLQALKAPGHSLELNMAIVRGLLYMRDENVQRLILRSIQAPPQ